MELASDLDAMDIFAEMSENDQQVWIDGARRMNTKDEMAPLTFIPLQIK